MKISDFMALQNLAKRLSNDEKDIKYLTLEILYDSDYDMKADIYSLGAILQELFVIDLKE